jgi:hypothetical protein
MPVATEQWSLACVANAQEEACARYGCGETEQGRRGSYFVLVMKAEGGGNAREAVLTNLWLTGC